jgi:hypothetical protein
MKGETMLKVDVSAWDLPDTDKIGIHWVGDKGFGEVILSKDPYTGKWSAHTECMCSKEDKEFLKELFNSFIDEIEDVY